MSRVAMVDLKPHNHVSRYAIFSCKGFNVDAKTNVHPLHLIKEEIATRAKRTLPSVLDLRHRIH